MKYFLEIKQTTIGYTNPLVSEIDSSLELGEVCLLMGNNGIGKTTLIKSILGQNKLLKGEISINGKSIQLPKVFMKIIASFALSLRTYANPIETDGLRSSCRK